MILSYFLSLFVGVWDYNMMASPTLNIVRNITLPIAGYACLYLLPRILFYCVSFPLFVAMTKRTCLLLKKQKLAIISAWLHEPKLIMMDEPFVGLDPKATFILKEIMHDMCKKGAAVFFSTHVLDVAEKLCNKVAIIKKGQLIASGTMEELTNGQSLESVFMEVVNE